MEGLFPSYMDIIRVLVKGGNMFLHAAGDIECCIRTVMDLVHGDIGGANWKNIVGGGKMV
jgi:hypothetical protein